MAGFVRWCDPDGYGNGTWGREVSKGLFHVIEVTDIKGNPKYVVELCSVDLNEITDKVQAEAKKSCGWDGAGDEPRVLAEMCHQYGAKALLHSVDTNSRSDGFRACRKESYALSRDASLYEERMSRPVNKIGSSAREAMQGDFTSAMVRGVAEGRPDAKLMAKIHGVPAETVAAIEGAGRALVSARVHSVSIHSSELEEASGGDPLAYSMGYMRGMSGGGMDGPREELAEAYVKGYKRGVSVRLGEQKPPSWIKAA